MKKIMLIGFVCLLGISCSKDKDDSQPGGDDVLTMRFGAKAYSFSNVPDASANYYDAANGTAQFRLNGADGVSFVEFTINYLYEPEPSFSISTGTGAPTANTGSGGIKFTDEEGVLYELKTVDEDPWFTGMVTSIQDDVWTGTFAGYVNHPEGARFEISEGKFDVKLLRR